jgi:hypothetical protein
MFFFAFERQLIDSELYGIKSYQALWLRIQNEIVSSKFNNFTDIIDLDRFGSEIYTSDSLLSMSRGIAATVNAFYSGASMISSEKADELLSNAQFAMTSLPRQVALATVNPDHHVEDMGND